jgi:predicted nucleic acid-binding protein
VIVVDANYFLRAIVRPATPQDAVMAQTATTLFERVKTGEDTIFVSDAVVAEVVFILSSKRHYGLPRIDVVARLAPMLQLNGCRLIRKRVVLRALDLWGGAPKLSFVDALGATYAQELGRPLASFDADLGKVPGITLWQPPKQGGTT